MEMKQRLEEMSAHGASPGPFSRTSDVELLASIESNGQRLLRAEVRLASLQMQDQLAAEILLTRRLIIGSALVILGSSLLCTGLLKAFSFVVPEWLAAVAIGAFLITAGWTLSLIAWRRQKSLAQIQSELTANLL